jgi:hypothetical protein
MVNTKSLSQPSQSGPVPAYEISNILVVFECFLVSPQTFIKLDSSERLKSLEATTHLQTYLAEKTSSACGGSDAMKSRSKLAS